MSFQGAIIFNGTSSNKFILTQVLKEATIFYLKSEPRNFYFRKKIALFQLV